jgi:hypothetical protein
VNVEPYASSIYAEGALCGVSAKAAAIFEDCNRYKSNQHGGYRESSITNIGVKIRARVLGSSLYAEEGRGYMLPLNCTMHGQSLSLRLRQIRYDKYLRANPAGPFQCGKDRLQRTRPAECNLLTVLRKERSPSPLVEHESKLLYSNRTHML